MEPLRRSRYAGRMIERVERGAGVASARIGRAKQRAGVAGRRIGRIGRAALLLAAAACLATAAAARGALLVEHAAAGAAGDAGEQYALIVNGDDSFTHNYNVELALTSLARLGYEPRNTFVLAPTAAQAAGGGAAAMAGGSWWRPATEEGLRQALAALRPRLRSGDRLLVYLTGHGYRMFGRPVLGLADGSINARDLLGRLAALPFGTLILIADQCYSGGFVKAAVALGRNVVAVSSADDRHESRCEPFVRPFWLAALAAESDANGDGAVSVEEAFRVADRGVRQAAARTGGDDPQYAASGTCAAGENRFSSAAPSPRLAIAVAATATLPPR
jgi:hypothetical protein